MGLVNMGESIIVALITGGLALIGTIITVLYQGSRTQKQIEINQAVTKTEITELTREVRAHNNFAQRLPVVEEQIKVINHRISDLEEVTRK